MPRDTILDAWCKGYSAARDGEQVIENPYPEGTKLAEVWARAREKSLDAAISGLPVLPLQVGYRW
jgi:hypothetical protein